MRPLFRSYALAVTLAIALVAAGCSTGPDEADEERIDMTAAEDLVQTADVLVAARMQPESIGELTPLFQRLAQTADNPLLRELADISPDPIGHMANRGEMPNELPALDQSAPMYVLFTDRGNTDFLMAAQLGLPTQIEEWPQYYNVRLLLPTDDSEQLAEQMVPWLEGFEETSTTEATELYRESNFVRVEMAVQPQGDARRDTATDDADEWLAGLNLQNVQPPATADYRPTPAFDAFVESDAPFGFWTRVQSLSALGTLELLEIFAGEYDNVAPVGQPQFFLEGVPRLAAASIADDPVSAEFEDVSLLMRADAEGALAVDGYATRTEQGVRVHQGTSTDIELPDFQSAAEAFLRLSFQSDLDGLDETVALPLWSTFEQPTDVADLQAGFDGESVDDALLPFADDPAMFPMLTMAVQYPWAAFAATRDTVGDIIPLPTAVAVEVFAMEPGHELPLGGVAAAAFGGADNPRAALDQWLFFAEQVLGDHFDADMVDRDDGMLELHIALGTDLGEVFSGSDLRVRPSELSLDLGGLQASPGALGAPDALDLFDHIDIRSSAEPDYQAVRLSFGSPESLQPESVDSRIEPRQNPQRRCRTEIAAASHEHLSDLRSDAEGHVDRWAEHVANLADDCIDPNHAAAPLIMDRLELARQIAAEIP